MHKAWPDLLSRMKNNQMSVIHDRDLVVASRTWFCLYLFEHQCVQCHLHLLVAHVNSRLSYGTGRPAILKDDESIWECRHLLQHPLAIEDDMRLVSTVELMAIRERVQNNIRTEGPVDAKTFASLSQADSEFRHWYKTWDTAFSQKYEDAGMILPQHTGLQFHLPLHIAFYRQSLQIQHLHAELFHNATALRGINGPEDVQRMPQIQRELAVRSIKIAQQGLDITVHYPAYREGMKYGMAHH